MSTSINIGHCSKKNRYYISFQTTTVSICIHQLIELLANIHENDEMIFELGFLHSLNQVNITTLSQKVEYQVFFGRTFFLLTQREMTEFLSQLWRKHPVMMQWVFSKAEPEQSRVPKTFTYATENFAFA